MEEIAAHYLWEIKPLLPLSTFSQIKKSGNNFYFSCPFHEEKTPSCWYTPNNGAIYCFGCASYLENLIYFYMKVRQKNFFPAIIRLAKFFKIKIEWENKILRSDEIQDEKYHRNMRSWY